MKEEGEREREREGEWWRFCCWSWSTRSVEQHLLGVVYYAGRLQKVSCPNIQTQVVEKSFHTTNVPCQTIFLTKTHTTRAPNKPNGLLSGRGVLKDQNRTRRKETKKRNEKVERKRRENFNWTDSTLNKCAREVKKHNNNIKKKKTQHRTEKREV